MAGPDLTERLRRSRLERYLLTGEVPVIAQRQHWAKIAEPTASVLVGLVLVLMVDSSMPQSASAIVDFFWWAWFAVCVRSSLKWFMWWKNWFVATDKRMLVNYGLINVNVAMLSMSKVVDLSYTRTTMGRLLGYGTFVRESSGAQQSLHEVKWVKDPDTTYLTLCSAIFSLTDAQGGTGRDLGPLGSPTPDGEPYARFNPDLRRHGAGDHQPSTQTQAAGPRQAGQDTWQPDPSPDEVDTDDDDDTGPIP